MFFELKLHLIVLHLSCELVQSLVIFSKLAIVILKLQKKEQLFDCQS